MRTVAKLTEMIAWFSADGILPSVKFKIANKDNTESEIKIDKIIKQSEERLAGNRMFVYSCLGMVGDKVRPF